MKKFTKNKIWIFDNPECFDRYTIIFQNGDILGCSDYPYSHQAFSQFCGNILDWNWPEKMTVKKYIANAIKDKTIIGVNIKFNKLPKDVQTYIQSFL